jgi:hypothetical protein
MAFVRVEQRNARLATAVKVEYVKGRDGEVAKGTVRGSPSRLTLDHESIAGSVSELGSDEDCAASSAAVCSSVALTSANWRRDLRVWCRFSVNGEDDVPHHVARLQQFMR